MKKTAIYRLFFIPVVLILMLISNPAAAEESLCDGYDGKAFGLCTAYCEAADCDSDTHHASEKACAVLALRFEKLTGAPPPCEQKACPAWGSGELDSMWAGYETQTTMDDEILRLPTTNGSLAWGDANITDDENYAYANIQWFPSLLAVYEEVSNGTVMYHQEWPLKNFDEYRACKDLLIENTAPAD